MLQCWELSWSILTPAAKSEEAFQTVNRLATFRPLQILLSGRVGTDSTATSAPLSCLDRLPPSQECLQTAKCCQFPPLLPISLALPPNACLTPLPSTRQLSSH